MGPGNEMGPRRAEQFPNLGNYTLTPAYTKFEVGQPIRFWPTTILLLTSYVTLWPWPMTIWPWPFVS